MAASIPQVQPIPNGVPIVGHGVVPGAVVQQGQIVYQQQQPVVLPHQMSAYVPRKPYVPRERHPNEEHCKIFVGAVNKDTTEETLRAYFGKFGEIADSVIMKNKATGEPRGFAFVTFTNADSVQAVIDQNHKGGHTLDGKQYLQVRKYFPKAEYDASKEHMNTSIGMNPMSANPQYKGPMKVSPELKIFVGGIGIGTTEDDVRKYFEGFGTVSAVDMPFHHVYKCPKGFAFVGFDSPEAVKAVTLDRYHQINGKTVEVKGADEQQAHMKKKQEGWKTMSTGQRFGHNKFAQNTALPTGTIGTVSGYGAYAGLAGAQQQIVIPQVQLPPATGGGYVYDPATNTYYQLPGTLLAGATGLTGGLTGAAANHYGMTIVGGAAGQQVLAASPAALAGRPAGAITADMLQVGAVYPQETSTFGPQRSHVIGAAAQQPIGGNTVADPHVVYSTSTSISAGDPIQTPRTGGFHPYGR